MQRILVLGAGRSSPYLIRHLLEQTRERDWIVAVADLDPDLAAARVAGWPRGEAMAFDVDTEGRLAETLREADLVVNLLPSKLQLRIARECVRQGRPMVSASYATPEIRALDAEARRRGVLLLTEIGLDPGIDHMSTMALIDRVRGEGGIVERFESYGSGVPAPDSLANPLAYAITWDPRNVVLAGSAGAHYLRDGSPKMVPWSRVFEQTWEVDVPGIGTMEAYANRDSLAYRQIFGLAEATTLIRGTLRYPGWCETWRQVVRLGLAGSEIPIPRLAERSFAELVELFLPEEVEGATTEERAARFLGLPRDSRALANLSWLGLFSTEPCGASGETATDALIHRLRETLTLPPGGRDLILLLHDLTVRYPTPGAKDQRPGMRRERITSTLIQHGERDGITAMARTVGLPAAIAARLVLDGELELTGCHIPTEPRIYHPVLAELAREGLEMHEEVRPAGDPRAEPMRRPAGETP